MTNADKIRNMSDEELAETYINVLSFDSVVAQGTVYQPKHSNELWIEKADAIKAELEWLQQEVECSQEQISNVLKSDDEEAHEIINDKERLSNIFKGYLD